MTTGMYPQNPKPESKLALPKPRPHLPAHLRTPRKRPRLPAALRQSPSGPFTPWNKNLAIGNWTVPNDGTFTRIENTVLFTLLNEARLAQRRLIQYRDLPPGTVITLSFKSLNTMWRDFGLGDDRSGWTRQRMLRALENLSALKFTCRRWYVSRKKASRRQIATEIKQYQKSAAEYGYPVSREQAAAKIAARHTGKYVKLTMGAIKSFSIDNDDGGRVHIVLDSDFYRVNNYGRFYVEVYLKDMLTLSTLTAQRVLLFIKCFRKGKALTRDIGAWAAITGLYDINPSRWRRKFFAAVEEVVLLRNAAIAVSEKRGVITLVAAKARGKRSKSEV